MNIPGYGLISEQLRRSTVRVGGGSGMIASSDGLVVTNAHVARSAREPVVLWDGREFEAPVTATSRMHDLALLRIPAFGLPAVTFADSAALRPGEVVLAVGNPLGFEGALSVGVVHERSKEWVRADVRLAPGNSGGPLANAHGEVIGMNTLIANGLAHAVPSNAISGFVSRGGKDARIGVTVRPVSTGLMVLEVEHGSVAERAGVTRGDILIGSPPFDSHDLTIVRGGKTVKLREVAVAA